MRVLDWRQKAGEELPRVGMTDADQAAQGEFVYSVVKEVISQWDPYGLLGEGRSIDELQPEMRAVCQLIGKIQSSRDASYVLSRVFSAGCDESGHFNPATCERAGQALYERLLEAGLIGGAPPSG